jgi:hypothetical protein
LAHVVLAGHLLDAEEHPTAVRRPRRHPVGPDRRPSALPSATAKVSGPCPAPAMPPARESRDPSERSPV